MNPPTQSIALTITKASNCNTIQLPLRANFAAQPDITAYELAQAMPFLFGKPMTHEAFASLGVAAQRHWEVSP